MSEDRSKQTLVATQIADLLMKTGIRGRPVCFERALHNFKRHGTLSSVSANVVNGHLILKPPFIWKIEVVNSDGSKSIVPHPEFCRSAMEDYIKTVPTGSGCAFSRMVNYMHEINIDIGESPKQSRWVRLNHLLPSPVARLVEDATNRWIQLARENTSLCKMARLLVPLSTPAKRARSPSAKQPRAKKARAEPRGRRRVARPLPEPESDFDSDEEGDEQDAESQDKFSPQGPTLPELPPLPLLFETYASPPPLIEVPMDPTALFSTAWMDNLGPSDLFG